MNSDAQRLTKRKSSDRYSPEKVVILARWALVFGDVVESRWRHHRTSQRRKHGFAIKQGTHTERNHGGLVMEQSPDKFVMFNRKSIFS